MLWAVVLINFISVAGSRGIMCGAFGGFCLAANSGSSRMSQAPNLHSESDEVV